MEDVLNQNAAKAKELLKEAGYDGTPVVLMQSTDLAVLTNLAPVAKAQLEAAGFKVDLQSMDWQTLVAPPHQEGSAGQGRLERLLHLVGGRRHPQSGDGRLLQRLVRQGDVRLAVRRDDREAARPVRQGDRSGQAEADRRSTCRSTGSSIRPTSISASGISPFALRTNIDGMMAGAGDGVLEHDQEVTRIAAQLAPQRSTQYSNLARDLAAAEVLAVLCPSGAGLQDVSLRSIAGQDYLTFSLPGPITDEAARLLASMAMLGGVFELFDAIGDVSGPLLRPVQATHTAFISPDMAATRRYKGKTNEAFTHFLCNMAKYASDFHSSDWSALDVVDPLCGGGTTLFAALALGADVAGIDMDRSDIETTATFIGQFCREIECPSPPRRSACASSTPGVGTSSSARTTICAAACWSMAMHAEPRSCWWASGVRT